jgi:hypothetical protein
MRRIGLAGVALAVLFLTMVPGAWAEATATICVPERASSQVLSTNAKGECPAKLISKTTVKYKAEALPGTAELEKLDTILPHVNYVESGVGGKPTIQFSGVNVQVVNGEGKTESVNGEGNLVIGYDENAGRAQTGSHNLILGEEQAFSSFGGLVAGFGNTISGREASVSGGALNTASGFYTSVTGGMHNTARVEAASVQGGSKNLAEGRFASIFGGKELTAKTEYEAIP